MDTGLGIRPEFFNAVLDELPPLGFLEAHSENYFRTSIARAKLLELRNHYPISLHGVGLSLGRADGLDLQHLNQLTLLVDEIEPFIVSEHLAWSAYSHRHLPDLLPLPLTDEAFAQVCAHITQMQDALQRQILLENPSNYLAFDLLQVSEAEFLNSVASQTGCGLLMDINNIHVSAQNLGRDSSAYINAIDSQHIKQYHLAGYTQVTVDGDDVLIDTHNHQVYPPVWALYEQALSQHGDRPTLFEWDSDFPEFNVLLAECSKANSVRDKVCQHPTQQTEKRTEEGYPSEARAKQKKKPRSATDLATLQDAFLDDVLARKETLATAQQQFTNRIWVYQNNIFGALQDYLAEVYPATKGVVGDAFFRQMSHAYTVATPPSEGDIYHYGADFADVVAQFDGLSTLVYLDDLIAYEWAIHVAYFADLKPALNPAEFSQEALLQTPVQLNEGVWILESAFPIYEIHRQSLPDFDQEVKVELGQSADSLLVYKHNHQVKMRVISESQALFIQQVAKAGTLLQAIEQLSGSIDPESLSTALALVFELEILTLND